MITPEQFLQIVKENDKQVFKYGTINSVNGDKATIIFDGETIPSIKEYLAVSYSPNIDDRVLLLATQGTYLILGAIGGAGGGSGGGFIVKTSTEWNSENPILNLGEVGIESDTNKIKIGDGATNWLGLAYMTQGQTGKSIEYNWNGTQLGIRIEGQTIYQYVDLKGAKGDKGDNLEFNWQGTELGVRIEGQSSYTYIDLKGEKGDTGSLEGLVIVDNLTSTDTDKPLSANMGRELFQSVSNGKSLIAGAITDKGVITSPSDSFSVMAGNIVEISSGIELVAGSYINYWDDTKKTAKGTYAEVREVTMKYAGSLKVMYNIYASRYQYYAQVYKNGVALGTEQTGTSAIPIDKTIDIDVDIDDVITLQIKSMASAHIAYNDYFALGLNEQIIADNTL